MPGLQIANIILPSTSPVPARFLGVALAGQIIRPDLQKENKIT
jgi:hypothetical protein